MPYHREVADDPYREPGASIDAGTVRKPARRRRWPVALLAASSLGAAIAGPGVLALIGYGLFGVGVVDLRMRRRRAVAILRAAPFGVVAVEPPRAIDEVIVRLARAPDDDAARRLGEALIAISDLAIAIDDQRISLTGWRWKYDDELLLAHVLDTWGRRVHADHGIVEVTVAYSTAARRFRDRW